MTESCRRTRWPRLRRLVGLGVVLAFAAVIVTQAGAATKHGTTPVAVSVAPSGQKLAVHVRTAGGLRCVLRVTAKHTSASLPAFRMSKKGKATIKWTIPTGAPSGTWTFEVTCLEGKHSITGRSRVVIINHGSGTGALIESNSTQLAGGATLDAGGGGGGAGPSPCAQVVGGGSQCFPSDPFNFYADPTVGADIGQCTWYAAGRRPDLDGITTGNAYQWLGEAQAKGVATGTTPVAGSIAVNTTYRDSSGTLLGHVAYVDGVSGSNLVVDEANVVPLKITLNVTVPESEFQGYIYGGPAGSGPGSSGGRTTPGGGSTPGGGTEPAVSPPEAKSIAAVANPNGNEDVFAETSGGINRYLITPTGVGNAVIATGSFLPGSIAAVANPNENEDVFAETSGGINRYLITTTGVGNAVIATGSFDPGCVVAVANPNKNEDVFAGTSGGINRYLITPTGVGNAVIAAEDFC